MIATPLLLQSRDHREQQFGLAVGQRRGWLVHHQNAGVLRQRLGDFDHLLLGDAEAVHRDARIDIEPDHVENAFGFGINSATVNQSRQPRRGFAAEEYVLGEIEIGNERELLKNDSNAEFAGGSGIVDRNRFAVVEERAPVGTVGAAQDFH